MTGPGEAAWRPGEPGGPGEGAGGMVELAPGVSVAQSAIRLRYSRSSGPGGQNVNKVNTRTQLWVRLCDISGLSESAAQRLTQQAPGRITAQGEIYIDADVERTQEGNRQAVFERLRALIGQALVEPRRRKKRKISKAAKAKRISAKRQRGEVKSKRRYRGED